MKKIQLSFDELCQNRILAFTIFSKVNSPHQLIEDAFKLALQEHRARISTTLYSSVLATFSICLILKTRNPIFALTARSTFWGVMKKYYFVPVILTQPFQHSQRKAYDEKIDKIMKKYDFNQPEFHEAFNQIEANGGLQKLMKKYLTEKDNNEEESEQPQQPQQTQ